MSSSDSDHEPVAGSGSRHTSSPAEATASEASGDRVDEFAQPDAATPNHDAIVDRHRGLVGRTLMVSGMTLISRILGFVREMISAALFGDGSLAFDAFLTAWRVPNLFRRFLGEGALSTSLQTAMTESDAAGGDAAGSLLFRRTLRLVTVLLFAVCLVSMAIVLVLPDRMPGTGWAWMGDPAYPVRDLTLRLMPFVVLVCLSAICTGALHVRAEFRAPALGPVAMNAVWIAALVFVGITYGWEGDPSLERQMGMARVLAWGVLVAGAVQFVVQLPALFRTGLLGGPRAALGESGRGGGAAGTAGAPSSSEPPGSRLTPGAVLRASLPLALGAAVYQINVMVDGLMAIGLLEKGGATAIYLANRVQQFPLAMIAVAATASVFPSLKALGHVGRRDELRALHDRTQFAVAFLAIPAGVGLYVLAEPIGAVLFRHGAYGQEGVERIASALRCLSIALLPAGAVGLASRCYYALSDFRTPVRISIVMLLLNAGLNVLFVAGLELDTAGLALATAITSWGNLLVLLPGLRRTLGLPPAAAGWGGRLARIALAGLGAGGSAHLGWSLGVRLLVPDPGPDAAPSLALVVAAVAGVVGFAIFAAVLRIPEWRDVLERVRRRRR